MAAPRRRWKRVVFWWAPPLLLLLLLTVAWFTLASNWGTAQVRHRLLEAVNGDLAGKLEIGALTMKGTTLLFDGLKLYTPEGELVVEIAHVELEPRLLALTQQKVVLDRLRVVKPRFYLRNDDRGLNLNRAIASKRPPASANDPTHASIHVGEVQLEQGHFEFAFGEEKYAVEEIALDGRVSVTLPSLTVVGDLHLGANITAPLKDTLNIDVAATSGKPGEVALDLYARSSDSLVKGRLWLDPVKLVVTDAIASPRAVRAFAPGVKLKVPVTTRGTVSPGEIDVTVTAGRARATAHAKFPKTGALMDDLELHASDVDLSELLEGARPSHLSADLTGRLTSVAPDAFDGEVKGQARWVEDGQALATADVDIVAVKGKIEARRIEARVPGATFDARGRGDRSSISASGGLAVSDLRAVARALADFTGSDVLPLSGSGRLTLKGSGPLLHPSVSASGGFESVAWDDVVLSGVKADVTLADVRKPLETQGSLRVQRLQVGSTVLEGLSAETKTAGKKLTATLGLKAPAGSKAPLAALSLVNFVEATIDPDNQGLQLTALTVSYPKLSWALESPAHLGWTDAGDVTVEPIALRAGEQRLVADFSLAQKQLLAHLLVAGVDLAQLPRALVPERLRLTGLVDAKAKLWGTAARPEAELGLAWRAGSVMGLEQVAVESRAHYLAERVDGTLRVSTRAGDVAADFAVPVARRPGKPQPVALHVKTGPVDVAAASSAFGAVSPVTGVVSATLDVDGTLAAPRPVVRAEGANLAVLNAGQTIPVDRAALAFEPGADGRPVASLAVTAMGGLTQVTAVASLTVAELLDAQLTPRGVDWSAVPLQVEVQSNGVDLSLVSPVAGLAEPLNGKLKASGKMTGTVAHPDVDATVAVLGLQAEGKQPLDLAATLVATRDDTRLSASVRRGPRPLAVLTGRLGGPLERVGEDTALMETPLFAEAEIGPLELSDLVVPADAEDALPGGSLRAHLEVKGTGAEPKGSLRGTLEAMKLGKASLGQANLTWDYEARTHTFAATLTSGGRLKARGTLGLDVSVPAVRRGLDVGKAPLSASLTAADFDVSFFSGIHPTIRTLAGTLKMDLAVEGELANPTADGNLAWSNGRVGVAGYGEYRDVQLKLSGGSAGYALEQLSAKSGAGTVALSGKAMRAKPGVFTLWAEGKLSQFPVITDDQLLAFASADLGLGGEASAERVDLQLKIPNAHVELPEVKRKDLQGLDRPPDIVLVRNGVPVKKKKKPVDPAAPAKEAARTFRLTLDAPRNLWVKGADVNLELGLSEKFRIEVTDRTLIFGEANVMRGRLDVIGRRFDIQRNAQVRFGGIATQPYLNLTATHVNERENVTVFVTVVGRGRDASLKLTSQPPIPDSEILILLATGRRSLKRGGGSSVSGADAASVLGSLAASQLKTMLAKRLPLDVLSIESGDTGIEDARVEAGVYLSDRIYIGYQLQLGADRSKGENGNSVKFEYQLQKEVNLELSAGDAPSAGGEVVWGRDF